ncbi:hypothetical protein SNEBB_009993 [Seison nebaliae]|nr:hypothetical protein SNEBB_009993 [Seison nebaliae]
MHSLLLRLNKQNRNLKTLKSFYSMTSSTANKKVEVVPHCENLFSELRGTTKAIDLGVGAPGPELLAKVNDLMKRNVDSIKEIPPEVFLQYGPRAGSINTRKLFAQFLTRQFHSEHNWEDIIVSNGASSGLLSILTQLKKLLTSDLYVEDATYFIALPIFDNLQFDVYDVPSPNGFDIDNLEKILKKKNKQETNNNGYNGVVYLTPIYSNPRGRCLSELQMKNLISVARKYNLLIIAEDVYSLMCQYGMYESKNNKNHIKPLKRLFEVEKEMFGFNPSYEKGHVIMNCSFSKIMSPALRCGWIETSKQLNDLLTTSPLLTSSGGLNHYTSQIVAGVLESNDLDNYLSDLNKENASRMKTVCDILQERLPKSCKVFRPDGGYFIWIEMPENWDSNILNDNLKSEIFILPGQRTTIGNAKYRNCFRLSIAYYDNQILSYATNLICDRIHELFVKLK